MRGFHKFLIGKPGRRGRVVSASTCQVGGLWFKSGILPLLKHACGESNQLLCWLYTPAEVSHTRWISGNIYPQSLNKAETTLALKPRGDVTRSPKQGYQWPQKWACVQQNLKKKKKFLIGVLQWQIYYKIYFEAYINKQYFWLKNNTAQLERESRIRPVNLRMTDIHRFSNRKWFLI